MGHRYFDRTGCIHFFLHPVVDLSDEPGNRSVGLQLVIETHKIQLVNPLFPDKCQSTSDNIVSGSATVCTVSDELIAHEMKFYMFWIFVLWMALDTVISGPVISNAGM